MNSSLIHARTVARVLDSGARIPGTKIRFGLDPILGLVPGLGDVAGAVLSGYIVLVGVRLGASRSVVLRMLANILIDTVVGSVPLLGDAFDVVWKSNNRNVALLERFLERPEQTRAASRALILAVVVVLAVLAVGAVIVSVIALRALIALLAAHR
ncbi:MAG TPA: DUF4112 domain-containing protein [Gemmatimonadaceae bacterium]